MLAAAQSATGAINGVPAQFLTTFLGEPGAVVAAAATAINQINSIPPSHSTNITAVDSASTIIQRVLSAYNSIPSQVTTIIRAIQANEGGGITTTRMAAGGILPMASGGHLTPMSGSTARVVGPNTWRVIGDRPHGDEAFIPLNGSAASTALLGVAAARSGFGLVPMGSGGFSSRDRRAWDWLEELLRRFHHGHHGGGGSGGGPVMPTTIGTAVAQRVLSSVGFGGSGGVASYLKTVMAPQTQILQPTPTVPSPSHGGGGRSEPATVRLVLDTAGTGIDTAFLQMFRKAIRVQGGNVQVVLGSGS